MGADFTIFGADVFQVFLTFIAAGAVYGGIRADLKHLSEKAAQAAHNSESAHNRITEHILQFHSRRKDD